MLDKNAIEIVRAVFLFFASYDVLIAFSIFLATKAKKQISNLYFIVFLIVGIWEILIWFAFFVTLGERMIFIVHALTYAVGAFGLFALIYFLWVMLEKAFLSKRTMVFFGLVAVSLAVISLIPNVVVGEHISLGTEAYEQFMTTGSYQWLFYIGLLPLIGTVFYLAIRGLAIRDSVTAKRFHIIGTVILIVFSIILITNILVPIFTKIILDDASATSNAWYIFQQNVGVMSLSFLSTSFAFAVLRYRLFNVRIAISKKSASRFIIAFYYIAVISISIISGTVGQQYTFSFLVFVLGVCGHVLLRRRIRSFLDHYFFEDSLVLSKTLDTEKIDRIDPMIEMRPMSLRFQSRFEELFSGVHTQMFFLDRPRNRFLSCYEEDGNLESISLDLKAIQSMKSDSQVVYVLGNEMSDELTSFLKQRNATALVVCRTQRKSNSEIVGLCLLSGVFELTKQTEDQLNELCDQFAAAMKSNVTFYESLIGFQQDMKEYGYQ